MIKDNIVIAVMVLSIILFAFFLNKIQNSNPKTNNDE